MPKAAITTEDNVKLREWTSKVVETFNGMDDLGEPFLTMFKNLKDQYNGILDKLPMTDAVSAAQEAHWNLSSFLSVLTSSQAMLTYMGQQMQTMRSKNSEADPALVLAAVNKAIDEKVAAGELVKKDVVTSLCSDAKMTAFAEGEKKVRDEIAAAAETAKTIAARKTLLTTNSLPLPKDDALLGGTDAEFEARKTTATSRVELLKGKKVALNSPLMSEVWGDDRDFGAIEKAVTHLRASEAAAPAEPFSKKPSDATKPLVGNFMV